MFVIGNNGFGEKKPNPNAPKIEQAEPRGTIPDSVLKFATYAPKDGFKKKLSESDMKLSYYSSLPPEHYYEMYDGTPIALGRYTFAAVIQRILLKYGNGSVERFKAANVREYIKTF